MNAEERMKQIENSDFYEEIGKEVFDKISTFSEFMGTWEQMRNDPEMLPFLFILIATIGRIVQERQIEVCYDEFVSDETNQETKRFAKLDCKRVIP